MPQSHAGGYIAFQLLKTAYWRRHQVSAFHLFISWFEERKKRGARIRMRVNENAAWNNYKTANEMYLWKHEW